MSRLSRPSFRFVLEAVLIVLTAVVTGLMHLSAWAIAAAVFFVWIVAAVIEYWFSKRREQRAAAPAPRPEPEPVVEAPVVAPPVETVRVVPREPEPEPGPEPEPEPEPVAATPPPIAPPGPRNWNLWDIERAQRDRGEPDDEREFLLMYLRDYAGPDGNLPLEFDDLVRESFGELLGAPTG